MTKQDDHPLQLEKHLKLRNELSTVQNSSLGDVFRASRPGKRFSTVWKFLKARFGPGRLSSAEFISFGFDVPSQATTKVEEFAGKRAQQAFNKVYNDQTWYAVTKHKMLFNVLMKGAGQPIPETFAMYDRKGRGAGAPVMKTRDALASFLSSQENHPMFCKPTTGLLSIGSFRIDGKMGEKLAVNGRFEYTVDEVCDYIQGISKKGYLFQRVLEPHPSFSKVGCSVISSLRFVVLNHEDKANIHSAVLKFPASGEVADNFWREGSIIASVELDRGNVKRAILKTHAGMQVLSSENKEHSSVLSFTLPLFEDAKRVVLEAARFFPGVMVQSWDVALTSNGPVLLEVNFGGDLNLFQLASGKGVMSREYCDVLRQAGYRGKLPN